MSGEQTTKGACRSWIDSYRVAIEINGLELTALKKLSLVSHALAKGLKDYSAREEQKTLASVLDDVIRRIELAEATP